MIWKRKKKKNKWNEPGEQKQAAIKPLQYPAKIMLAWAEAIEGNKEIRDWLIQNGYKELGLFCFALRNKDDAREWLMENGYAHLMAMVNAIEGNEVALEWLKQYKFTILQHMALAGDGDEKAFKWLVKHGHKDFAMIAKKIQMVKDQIQRDNDDVHRISPE